MSNIEVSHVFYAEEYFEKKFSKIKKEVDAKRNFWNKITYLLKERESVLKDLTDPAEYKRTSIKARVKDSFITDQINEYVESEDCKKDMESFKERWNKEYKKLLEEHPKQTPRSFVKANEQHLPPEISEAFTVQGTKDISELSHNVVAGICLGMLNLKEAMESELEEIVNDNKLTKEDVQKVMQKCSDKIQWTGSMREFAQMFGMAVEGGYVETKYRSAQELCYLTFPHFIFPGRSKESLGSERSLKDAFADTSAISKAHAKSFSQLITKKTI